LKRRRRFNAEPQRVAETRRAFIFSAFLSVSAFSPSRCQPVSLVGSADAPVQKSSVRSGREMDAINTVVAMPSTRNMPLLMEPGSEMPIDMGGHLCEYG